MWIMITICIGLVSERRGTHTESECKNECLDNGRCEALHEFDFANECGNTSVSHASMKKRLTLSQQGHLKQDSLVCR